jgi:hypothetical protein
MSIKRTPVINGDKIKRPYFGRQDLMSDDKYGRALNNYSKKSPYNVTSSTETTLLKRGKP